MERGKNSASARSRLIRATALLVWVVMLLWPSFARGAQSAEPKRIVVLNWYDRYHNWNVKFEKSFEAALQSAPAGTVEHYIEYLETNRFPGEQQSRALRDFLRLKYVDRAVDVVVANSDASLDFLLKYRAELFPHAPRTGVCYQRDAGT
jgi:hypothetical protein